MNERLKSAKHGYDWLEGPLMDTVKAAEDCMRVTPYYAIAGAFITGLIVGWPSRTSPRPSPKQPRSIAR